MTTVPGSAEAKLARIFADFRYLAWVFAGLILVFLLVPATGILRPVMHIDKVLHLTGFYLLVLFFGLGYGFERRVLFFVCGIGWALLTEGLQGLLPWRDFSLMDLVFDAVGCSLVLVSSKRVGERIVDIIAKFFYIGNSPVGPGTLASLVFLVLFYLSPFESPSLPFALPALFAVGAFSAGFIEKREGEDPKTVVIDEVFGALVAVAFLPKDIVLYAAAFVLFRVLDITKPFPIGLTEKIRGGLGIMTDDLVAGLLTNVVIRVIWILLGPR